jgi:hypothetical protein
MYTYTWRSVGSIHPAPPHAGLTRGISAQQAWLSAARCGPPLFPRLSCECGHLVPPPFARLARGTASFSRFCWRALRLNRARSWVAKGALRARARHSGQDTFLIRMRALSGVGSSARLPAYSKSASPAFAGMVINSATEPDGMARRWEVRARALFSRLPRRALLLRTAAGSRTEPSQHHFACLERHRSRGALPSGLLCARSPAERPTLREQPPGPHLSPAQPPASLQNSGIGDNQLRPSIGRSPGDGRGRSPGAGRPVPGRQAPLHGRPPRSGAC